MGWTSYQINPINFNRKTELDKELWRSEGRYELLKSRMVGSVYYCAIKYKPTGRIMGYVCLTHLEDGEFFYKEMSEDMGPCAYRCPESILKILSPTDCEYAKDWRERCHKYNALEKIYKSKKPIEGELKYNLETTYQDFKAGDTIKLFFQPSFKTRKGQSGGYYTDGVYKWTKRLVLELDNLRISEK